MKNISEYNTFKDGILHLYHKSIFINFIEESIDIKKIKYIYTQGWQTSSVLKVLFFTDAHIYLIFINIDNFEKLDYKIKVFSFEDVSNIEYTLINKYQIELTFNLRKNVIVLNNEKDTDQEWSYEYLDYIKHIFKILTKNEPTE